MSNLQTGLGYHWQLSNFHPAPNSAALHILKHSNRNLLDKLWLDSKVHLQNGVEFLRHACMLCYYIVHLRYYGAKQRCSKEEKDAAKDLNTDASVHRKNSNSTGQGHSNPLSI
jgi:hypothetical protein